MAEPERKCSTCKFYEPAPIWRKGWCRNPLLYAPQQSHLVERRAEARSELPLLVELPIVRQEALGRDPQNCAAMNDDAAVKEHPPKSQRRADDQHRAQARRLRNNLREGGFGGVQQRVLVKQVLVRIGGD